MQTCHFIASEEELVRGETCKEEVGSCEKRKQIGIFVGQDLRELGERGDTMWEGE